MLDAVINSTPIISLQCINKLDILGEMYNKVYIPNAVYEEVSIDGEIKISKEVLLSYPFFSIRNVFNEDAKRYFRTAMHKGEVEVMILSNELRAGICIMDDQLARSYAKFLGLRVTGTLGVLIKAKEKRIIDKVIPYMNELIQNDIYISKKLYSIVKEITCE